MYMLTNLVEALRAAQMVPARTDALLVTRWLRPPAVNLLPRLADAWERDASDKRGTARRRRRARHTSRRLTRFGPAAMLTLPVPWGRPESALGRLGCRLQWWPAGVPRGSLIAVASSRVQRPLEARSDWFAAFRAACRNVVPQRDRFLTARHTTTDVYVRHWASRFRRPLVEIRLPSRPSLSLRAWWQAVWRDPHDFGQHEAVWLSPEMSPDGSGHSPERSLPRVPLRDRALLSLADTVYVVHLRRNGQWPRLLTTWFADAHHAVTGPLIGEGHAARTAVYLAANSALVPSPLTARLCERGAGLWFPLDSCSSRTEDARHRAATPATSYRRSRRRPLPSGHVGERAAPVVALPPRTRWQMLTHCTRAPGGPWPDESVEAYRDALMFDRSLPARSALETLQRIVEQRRLLAASRGIRGGSRVVCFTAVPLADLPRLRVYRPHRTRWDFVPYGICIRRRWLSAAGAKPVRYGDDALWRSLRPGQRPWFQKQCAGCRAKTPTIDWRVEQEWRHVGDVHLESLPGRAALLFVPSLGEAERLSRASPWPVTVLEAP